MNLQNFNLKNRKFQKTMRCYNQLYYKKCGSFNYMGW